MATYEITDSVLKRHYEQHLSIGGSPLADRFERVAAAATSAGASAASSGQSAAATGAAADIATPNVSTPAPSSMWKKIIPIVGLALLAWLGMKFFGGSTGPDVAAMGKDLTGMFSSATTGLEGITDAESAKAALPKLTEVGTKVDGLTTLMDKVPDAGKGALSKIVGDNLGKLQALVEKVTALPGVGDIIKPVIDPIMEKLGALGG